MDGLLGLLAIGLVIVLGIFGTSKPSKAGVLKHIAEEDKKDAEELAAENKVDQNRPVSDVAADLNSTLFS